MRKKKNIKLKHLTKQYKNSNIDTTKVNKTIRKITIPNKTVLVKRL